jgi:hypothetical protein
VADPARGTLMGNRGCLHDEHGRIRRFHSGKRWIFCRLEFKGRKRELMQPGRYTELFFLDEATAFAAGHRPCAECMRDRFNRFRDAWEAANPSEPQPTLSATAIDEALHAERIGLHREKVTFRAKAGELPNGVLVIPVDRNGAEPVPRLIWQGAAWRWDLAGYADAASFEPDAPVDVLTPRPTVRTFAAGFRPHVAAR